MTVHGLPAQNTEKYMTRDELADALSVHVTTIDRWRAKGMPSVLWSRRVRRFLRSRAEQWLNEQEGRAA